MLRKVQKYSQLAPRLTLLTVNNEFCRDITAVFASSVVFRVAFFSSGITWRIAIGGQNFATSSSRIIIPEAELSEQNLYFNPEPEQHKNIRYVNLISDFFTLRKYLTVTF
jgi:hypothetical protein